MCIRDRCYATNCIRGAGGSLEGEMRVFATPATAQTLIRSVLYSGSDSVGQRLTITIDDFDDQVAPYSTSRGRPPAAVAVISLIPETACASFIGATCGDAQEEGGCGGGIISNLIGAALLLAVLLLWLIVCCRQRARTASRCLLYTSPSPRDS